MFQRLSDIDFSRYSSVMCSGCSLWFENTPNLREKKNRNVGAVFERNYSKPKCGWIDETTGEE